MRIVVLVASPRVDGNTQILADNLIDGAISQGAGVTKYTLSDYHIELVRDCRACKEEGGGECAIKDDAFWLRDKVLEADITVFATPLYWYSSSGYLKNFVDRWHCYYHEFVEKARGRGGFLLTPFGEEDFRQAEHLVGSMRLALRQANMHFLGYLLVGGVNPRGAVLKNAHALAQAYAWGQRLATLSLPDMDENRARVRVCSFVPWTDFGTLRSG